jgi:hypothetical protein
MEIVFPVHQPSILNSMLVAVGSLVAGKFGMETCQVWQNSILDTGVQLFIQVHHPFQAHYDLSCG